MFKIESKLALLLGNSWQKLAIETFENLYCNNLIKELIITPEKNCKILAYLISKAYFLVNKAFFFSGY